jgi:uncharacterized protein
MTEADDRAGVDALILRLDLRAHPEGGFYRETYRSDARVETARGWRSASTAILYLLRTGECSHLHRIASDELWHHYAGDPLEVVVLGDGPDASFVLDDVHPQGVVRAGEWFGARLVPGGSHGYALVGCTVAPGFDFADFELADRGSLLERYPSRADLIHALTRD